MSKFIDANRYYRAGYYLRWTTVEPRDIQWKGLDDLELHERAIKEWCVENAKGGYSWTNATRYVNFERRQDATLFKLIFG